MQSRPLEVRFWEKVAKSDSCWLWTAAKNTRGYGKILRGRSIVAAHRVSWTMRAGEIPDGMDVCHRCDNPACVRPDHLFLGTALDNVSDMISKGRNARGEQHPKAKLTEDDVRAIRDAVAHGVEQKRLAPIFGVGKQLISRVVRREDWRHVA